MAQKPGQKPLPATWAGGESLRSQLDPRQVFPALCPAPSAAPSVRRRRWKPLGCEAAALAPVRTTGKIDPIIYIYFFLPCIFPPPSSILRAYLLPGRIVLLHSSLVLRLSLSREHGISSLGFLGLVEDAAPLWHLPNIQPLG